MSAGLTSKYKNLNSEIAIRLTFLLSKHSSWRRSVEDVLKTSSASHFFVFQDVFKISSRRFKDEVLQARLEDFLKTSCKGVLKTRLEDVLEDEKLLR